MKSERDSTPSSKEDGPSDYDKESWWTEYVDQLLRFCANIMHKPYTHPDVQDVHAEACLKIVLNWDKFRGQSSRWTWARRIARNAYKDHIKKAARRATRETNNMHAVEHAIIDTLPSDGLDVKELIVEAALHVPQPYLNAVWLHIAGYSGPEIAKHLGVSNWTAYRWIDKAKNMLKEL